VEQRGSATHTVQRRVVILDDEPEVLDALRMLLEHHDYGVDGFDNGADFLSALRSGLPVDCLLLDAHLPVIEGEQVAQQVRLLNPTLPIIGITAWPASPMAHATSRAGARVMLTKPVSAEKLLEVLEQAMGGAA